MTLEPGTKMASSSSSSPSTTTRCTADPIVARIISSSIGSIITALAVTPLDVVKVRQQALSAEPFAKDALAHCTRCGAFVMNNGLIHGELVLPKKMSPHFNKMVCNIQHGVISAAASVQDIMVTRTQAAHPPPMNAPVSALITNQQPFPPSIFRGIGHIYKTEGLSGIYAGLAPTLVMSIPATVLYFTAYDELKLVFTNSIGASTAPAVAGMTARILASAVTSPFELVRTLMQSQEGMMTVVGNSAQNTGARMGTIQSMRALIQNGGILSLWRGLEPTLWRDVPFSAIYWFVLENTRSYLEKTYPSQSPMSKIGRDFAAGAGGGMLAAAITTPFDLVKTRRQL
jgi:solute carrier family 25, member 39/40